MKPGLGVALRDSRITRGSMTWCNGILGRYIDTTPEGWSNLGGVGRSTNLIGSAQERVNLNAGNTAWFFKQPYEQPTPYLSDDSRYFRYGGFGGWSVDPTLGSVPTFSVVMDTAGGNGYIGQITHADKSSDGTSGVSISLDGLEIGRQYTAIAQCSANWTGTSSAFASTGTTGSGTTSATPTYPVTVTAGNILFLLVVSKYAYCDDAAPIAAGFTLYAQVTGGDGIPGAGTGNVYLKVYSKIALGTETGTISVTGPSLNTIQAQFIQYTGTAHDLEFHVVPNNVASGTWTVTYPEIPDTQTGDRLLVISGVNTGSPTFNTPTPTLVDAGGGATFTWVAQRYGTGQFNGDDSAGYVQEFSCTGIATGAVTHSMTANTGTPAGASILVRIRNNGASKITVDSPLIEEPVGYRSRTMSPNQWESIGISFVATKSKHSVYIANKASTVTGNVIQFSDFDVYTEGWGTDVPATPNFSAFGTPQALTTSATVPYPATTVAGEVATLFISTDVGVIAPPAGWTPMLLPTAAGGMTVALYKKTMNGTEGGTTISVTTTGGTKGVTYIETFAPTGRKAIDIVAAYLGTDEDATTTAYSASSFRSSVRRNDRVAAMTIQQGGTYSGNNSGNTFTAVGATLGTSTSRTLGRSGANTLYYATYDADVRGGGDQVALTFAGTATGGNASGATVYVVVREAVTSTASLLESAAPDPVMRAYKALVVPQDFWNQSDTAPLHVFKAGGLPSSFTSFGSNTQPARLDGEWEGIYRIDDANLPSLNAVDALGPRARREDSSNLALPSRQIGSAFRGVSYPAPVSGVNYRGYEMKTPSMTGPLYISAFFRTTFNSFNFLGSYLRRSLLQFNSNSTNNAFLSLTLGNSTELTSATIGQICAAVTDLGTEYSKTYLTGATVNDGKWHHVIIEQIDNTNFDVYLDGATKANTYARITSPVSMPGTNLLGNGVSVGSPFYFTGFDGDIYGIAIGDAANVTYDRIKYLAAARTLPDYVMGINSGGFRFPVDNGTFFYIDDGIQFVNATVQGSANNMTNTTLPVTLASTTPGHVNVIEACFEGNTASTDPAPATPAGWSLAGYAWNGTTSPIGSAVYWRKYQTGDPTTVTLSWTNTGQAEAVCKAYAGVDTTTPITDCTVQNQVASSGTKTTANLTMSGSGWVCQGYADRTGTSDYTGYTETLRGQRRNASASSIISLDTNRLLAPTPTAIAYSITGPVTSVGQNWIYRLQPALDATWSEQPGRLEGYSGSRWVPGVKAYSPSSAAWERSA